MDLGVVSLLALWVQPSLSQLVSLLSFYTFLFIIHLSVLVQGYTWYYFSSVKKVVDRIQETLAYLEQARDNLSKGNLPSQALWFLLQATKSYVAFPGSDYVLDKVFDALRDSVDAHADEANARIAKAYTQIRDIIQQDGEKHVAQHTAQIMGIMRDLKKELQPSALALREVAEKHEVKKRIDEGLAATKAIIQDSKGRFGQLRQQVRLFVIYSSYSYPPLFFCHATHSSNPRSQLMMMHLWMHLNLLQIQHPQNRTTMCR